LRGGVVGMVWGWWGEPNSDTDGPSEDGDEEESENEVEEQSDDGARRLAFEGRSNNVMGCFSTCSLVWKTELRMSQAVDRLYSEAGTRQLWRNGLLQARWSVCRGRVIGACWLPPCIVATQTMVHRNCQRPH
jgi:hypothetical protein